MPLTGMSRDARHHQTSVSQHIKDLPRTGSLLVGISATTAAVLLTIASAGFGATYALSQGLHHGPVLAGFALAMALGLECAKPFAVEAVFSSLRTFAIGRALAMLALAAVAIAYSLTAELSLMALTRGDSAASRSKVTDGAKDARAELVRIVTERSAMTFTAATADTVQAARDTVTAAERTREAECGKRGPNCRAREADEAVARAALATAIASKAATDRAAKLDADAATVRARLAKAPATAAADPGAAALAAYLGVFGVAVDSSLLAQWLVLIGVIALETGSALAVLLVHAAGGPRERRRAAVQELPPHVSPEPANAPVALPAQAQTAPEQAPTRAPQLSEATALSKKTTKGKRGRPVKERKEAEARIIELARASGGKLSKNSVRKLGGRIGASRGTTVNAVASLIAAGIFVKTAAGLALGA